MSDKGTLFFMEEFHKALQKNSLGDSWLKAVEKTKNQGFHQEFMAPLFWGRIIVKIHFIITALVTSIIALIMQYQVVFFHLLPLDK